jgi:cell division protein FtsX
VLGFLVGEALRDLRRAGRVAVGAVVLITLSLAALGGFWLVSSNLGRAVAKWRDRVTSRPRSRHSCRASATRKRR